MLILAFVQSKITLASNSSLRVLIYNDHDSYVHHGRAYRTGWSLFSDAAKRAEITLELKEEPWLRATSLLKEGKVEVVFGALYNEKRNSWATFSAPVAIDNVFVYATKPHIGEKDFNLSSVGVIKGSLHETFANKLGFSQVYSSIHNKTIFRMLNADRLDFVIYSETVMSSYCKDKVQSNSLLKTCMYQTGQPLATLPIHALFRKNMVNDNRYKAINEQILLLYKTGAVKKLFEQNQYSEKDYNGYAWNMERWQQ